MAKRHQAVDTTTLTALISCRDVVKKYRMGSQVVTALNGVSLDIAEGDFVAIVGKSGSGKSTMMNMLGGLDQPDSGSIRIAGQEIAHMGSSALAHFRNETIGFVFQQFQLLPKKSALQNVMLPLQYRSQQPSDMAERARHALELVDLGERTDHKPTELSGGQQQRVAIARALVGDPKVLLADEPTGALDTNTTHAILSLMQELNRQGITIIVITHEDDVAAYARRVVEFRDGSIISDQRRDGGA